MACASFVKIGGISSSQQWIGGRKNKRHVSFQIRASAYSDELVRTAKLIASPGRGILAIDESNATCGKRLASIGLDNNETNRQAYRQLLLTTPGLGEYISGVILFEETLYQSTTDGKRFVECLREENIVPGIKVDKGLVPLPGSNNESWCQGLDGLASRSAEYYKQGARFAKWRTVVSIPCGPSALAVKEAAWGLARYAAISQLAGFRVEPNDHTRRSAQRSPMLENGVETSVMIDDDFDPWMAWAYKPRTVSLLLIGACFLIWASGVLNPESYSSVDVVPSVKRGVWAMIAVYLAYSLLQAPSTILIRPHPALWRLVHGMAVIYLVALTFLLFQNRDHARQFMKFLHPDLGIELPERSYGTDCRIYMPSNPTSRFKNVYDTLIDEFVLAHIFGWWGKAIMIRNQSLLWVLSVGFEFMELTFRHMLPNFNECWWDSIVLDILICNWFGIWAGMHTVRYFDGKTYEWVGISRQPSVMGKVKRTLGQFTPAQWDKDEWHPLLGPWRFLQVLTLYVVFLTVELNTFFLKFCLWVPPSNRMIVYRLILWWLIAIPAIREYNSYLQDRKTVKKVGAFVWISLAICIVELLICIKFGQGLYPEPMPWWLAFFWSSAGAVLVLYLIVWTFQLRKEIRRKRQ